MSAAQETPLAHANDRSLSARAKQLAVSILASELLSPIWGLASRDAAAILMLHRFEHRELGIDGHSPTTLARRLEHLRRNRYNIISLRELIGILSAGEQLPPRSVVFTVDDGYTDFASVAAPVFAAYDCPVTVFLVTGFLDGECWLWYDAIEYLFGVSDRGTVEVRVGDLVAEVSWSTPAERRGRLEQVVETLKCAPTEIVEQTLRELEASSGVTLPPRPTARFASMPWSDVHRLSRHGVDFGPHSHTHPILSRTSKERLAFEVSRSWQRLVAELPRALPVFCYPNGTARDVTARETEAVSSSGLLAGTVSTGGHCTPSRFRDSRFSLPRLAYDESENDFRQAVGGLERLRTRLRGIGRP